MVNLCIYIDPRYYSQFFNINKQGNKFIYAEVKKPIYRTLESLLIFWKKISEVLYSMVFFPNPYNWCFIKNVTNGKPCMILFNVDNLDISHVYPYVVLDILEDINYHYGHIALLAITRSKIQDYLGMNIDFSPPGKGKYTMVYYIGKCWIIYRKTLRGGQHRQLRIIFLSSRM